MRVDLTPEESLCARLEPRGECLEWTGCTTKKGGYGDLRPQGRRWRAHRLAYTLWVGPIPEGMLVCHSCDNRLCCLPAHLWLGTIDDNQKDMARKGRAYRGPHGKGNRKLTIDQVSFIRAAHKRNGGNWTSAELAAKFSTVPSNVRLILRGKTWRHLL